MKTRANKAVAKVAFGALALNAAFPALAFAAEAEQEGGISAILPDMAEFIPMLIAFIILWIILAKFGWPMFAGMLEKRENTIREALKKSEEAQIESERVLAEYNKQLADAKAQSAQNVRFLRSCGKEQDRAPCQGANARAGGKAVLAGHHHIQQDAVRPGAVLRRHLRSACQRRYGMPVPLQCAAHKRAHVRIVVYHQNVCHSLATISISHCIHKYKSHESPYKT